VSRFFDIFEVHSTECRLHGRHRVTKRLNIVNIEFHVEDVNIGKSLE